MPVGMTVVAPRHAEDALLDIAARFERESGFRTPPSLHGELRGRADTP
jgi:Asp-tRNA(Asn)/Glu-tRNA(Gln) amidotransferase A subunit family amidase